MGDIWCSDGSYGCQSAFCLRLFPLFILPRMSKHGIAVVEHSFVAVDVCANVVGML